MATLTPVNVARTGVDLAGAAVSASDKFLNTGKEMLIVTNGSGGSINATLVTPKTVDGNAVADPIVAIGAGVTKAIGPFSRDLFNDVDGFLTVNFSGTTTVTAKVVRLTPEIT